MKKPTALILILMTLAFSHTASSQNADTLYHKKHYNYVAYFPSESVRALDADPLKAGTVLCFGNIKDSLKNGMWIYFYSSGEVLAYGQFKKGFKTGKWKYYYTGKLATSVAFEREDLVTDRIVFDNSGCPAVIDRLRTDAAVYYELVNGRSITVSMCKWIFSEEL